MNVYTSVYDGQNVQVQTNTTPRGKEYTTLTINTSDSSFLEITIYHKPGELQFDISELPTQAIVDRKAS